MKIDLSKSLEQLEQDCWGEPTFDSNLVRRCHHLRTIPLRELEPGDLRILIGQNISLQRLVQLALDVLDKEPLLNAELYEGDLLWSLLSADPKFWQLHPPFRARLSELSHRAIVSLDANPESHPFADVELLQRAHARFHEQKHGE